jgi:transcriptional regulator with XRE-family HTH domain
VDNLLGRFLRERRRRIVVAQAGLPARRAGRAATLTQEDLAQLTGFSIRSISALEQGSEHRPSRELLDAITAALHLTGDDRTLLWYLAVDGPPPGDGYAVEVDPGLTRMVQVLAPHPACLYDELWNVLTYNTAFSAWVWDFADAEPGQLNLAKLTLLEEHLQHVMVDWEQFARAFMGRLRLARARRPANVELIRLVEELCDRSETAKTMWDHEAEPYFHPPSVVRAMRPPGHTDPQQHDDERHRVPVIWSVLSPTAPGDDRRLVALLLPDEHARPAGVQSRQACAACARLANP